MMNMMNNGMSGWSMMLMPLFFWILIIPVVVINGGVLMLRDARNESMKTIRS